MKLLPILCFPLALAGCLAPGKVEVSASPQAVSQAERNIASTDMSNAMKDPESTRFRNWRGYTLGNGDRVICGEVNAKNSFGAYVGYDPFYIRLRGSDILAVRVDFLAVQSCQDAASGTIAITEAL